MLDGVKNILLVISGKGGVGKSTVSVHISLALKDKGFKVGLLDVDLCGPSLPFLLGLEDKDVFQSTEGWVPVYLDEEKKLGVMSIGFLLKNKNDSVVWRGPKKTSMIRQFLNDVYWQDLDYLVIDTPPGTSDEHITLMECLRSLKNKSAVVVTTPQLVALEDVQKQITFCSKTGIPILGLIENMSGYICPHCSESTNIFSKGGGESLANACNINFLGSVPLDISISNSDGLHKSLLDSYLKNENYKQFSSIVNKIIDKQTVPCN
ncbi:Nucleotide-binding protein, putative [Pediculus humanus corporis]|uniref:Cytosolic Fe-S cluster assembly factor NUBP2 homolog n=1 Tax=Pediculus humanus subsp. corporis TaxID=121224 RepID=E0VBG4_PEDHC|nr:Nucleotide-binding protein, putative [Pediculus humanus corporis]EEB10720.1 Nucleotide-binding protein, putative [Pediculus humanus corporis]